MRCLREDDFKSLFAEIEDYLNKMVRAESHVARNGESKNRSFKPKSWVTRRPWGQLWGHQIPC